MNKLILLLLSLALFSGCSPSTMMEKIADDEKERIARDYIQRMIDGDLAALAKELDPALRSGNETAVFEQVRAMIPKEPPSVTNLVGYHVSYPTGKGAQNNLTYQFGFGSKWLLANAAWHELPDGTRQILGLGVQPLPQSLQETNAFSFRHAGPWHYIFLLERSWCPDSFL